MRTSLILFSLLLGSATLALGQGFDPAAARSQIAASIALNQSLAREMTVGTQRLSRICDRSVMPVNQMPDLKKLDEIEAAADTFLKESRGRYEALGKQVEGKLKAHNSSTEESGVCQKPEKNNKKEGANYDAGACDNRNIAKNNYSLLVTDLKILIELLDRQVKAIDAAIALEAKRCIRGGFSEKLARALQFDGPSNHKSVAQDISTLLQASGSGK